MKMVKSTAKYKRIKIVRERLVAGGNGRLFFQEFYLEDEILQGDAGRVLAAGLGFIIEPIDQFQHFLDLEIGEILTRATNLFKINEGCWSTLPISGIEKRCFIRNLAV